MTHKDFDEISRKYGDIVNEKLTSKSKEYSTEEDKFHNFKKAGFFEQCTPEKALRGMLTKHIVSIYDIVDDIEAGNMRQSDEVVEEKITDAEAYLRLLAGLVIERRRNEN